MASSTAGPDSVHALDQLRQRLSQMSTSIASLKADLERHEPFPTWSSLQSSAQILAHNLSQLMATLDQHKDFFTASHAYPLTSFPGDKEPLLNQLLRKRLEPQTEDWLKTYDKSNTDVQLDLQQLWGFAGQRSTAIAQGLMEDGAFEDDYTLEEREDGIEKVNTGLRRKLADTETDGEEDDQDMRDAVESSAHPEQPAMRLEAVLKTISTGKVP